jgi:hypothetical protein
MRSGIGRTGLVATLAAAACTGTFDADQSRVLGTVAFYSQPVVVQVPGNVAPGAPFDVRVHTYGGGCERIGPTEAETRGDTIVVSPYDFTEPAGTPCPDILYTFEHSVTLSWPFAGDLTVVVRGREEPAGVERRYVREVAVR